MTSSTIVDLPKGVVCGILALRSVFTVIQECTYVESFPATPQSLYTGLVEQGYSGMEANGCSGIMPWFRYSSLGDMRHGRIDSPGTIFLTIWATFNPKHPCSRVDSGVASRFVALARELWMSPTSKYA